MPRRGLPGRRGRDSRSTGLSSGPEGPSSPGGVPAAAGIPFQAPAGRPQTGGDRPESTPARQALEVITVDSPRSAVLRRRAQPVRVVTRDVQVLIDQMFATMREARGLGLAAPQVGTSRRVIVVEVENRQLALVDPEIQRREGEEIGTEACLSIPGLLGDVPRAQRVVVRARNRRNRWVTVEAEGLLARVLQHEVDHLDGILFTDRVKDPDTLRRVGETSEVAPSSGPSGGAPDGGGAPSGGGATGTASSQVPL